MALLAMAVYDTEENGRTEYTAKTLDSLIKTINFNKHRLLISDNGSCESTQRLYRYYESAGFFVIKNGENLGTAKAINKAWEDREPGENCIKMDNDVVIHQKGWVDIMDYVIKVNENVGQVGLKRKDCWENPKHLDPFYCTTLLMSKHEPGEPWVVLEKTNHVMGTCVMHSAALLDKVGYLVQPSLYGFDDALMSLRSSVAGFDNYFLPSIEIDHIDKGDTKYQKWKEEHASQQMEAYQELIKQYTNA